MHSLKRRSDVFESIDKKQNSHILSEDLQNRFQKESSPRIRQQILNRNVQVGSHRLEYDTNNPVAAFDSDPNKQSNISSQINDLFKQHQKQKQNTANFCDSYATTTNTTTTQNMALSDHHRKPKGKLNSQSIVLNSSTINQLQSYRNKQDYNQFILGQTQVDPAQPAENASGVAVTTSAHIITEGIPDRSANGQHLAGSTVSS